MRQLLKFELYKIFKQRTIYLTFFLLLLFTTGFTYNYTPGWEKDMYREWEGPLTAEKVELADKQNTKFNEMVEKRVEEGKENQNGEFVNEKEHTHGIIYETIAFIKGSERQMKNRYQEIEQKQDYNTELEKSMIQKVDVSNFAYNKGPMQIIEYTSLFSILLTGCMLLIGLSATYTKEYSSGVDQYILSSSKGRSSLLWSKVLASFIYTASVVIAWEIFNLAWNGIQYGFSGWSTPIQNIFEYYFSPYSFTMLEYHLIQLSFHLLAALSFALCIILVSSFCKNALTSFFINGAILAVPFMIVGGMTLPNWIEYLFSFSFFYIMQVEFFFAHFHTINLLGLPLLYPIVALIWLTVLSFAFVFAAKRIIQQKEVTL
ncbi:hypothetical protein P8610_05530 [Fictibacillus sp. UD]|uniref:hypothetical protein n=1 Tax=Fictibacillus sp. UD TaxID=3038777 RepID=UPI0037450CD6